MRTVGFEEHWALAEVAQLWRDIMSKKYPDARVVEDETALQYEVSFAENSMHASDKEANEKIVGRLFDIVEGRVKIMDEEGVSTQVLSHISPGVQTFDAPTAVALARKVNDKMAESVKKFPGRFAGLVTIAPQDPQAAVAELDRTIRQLGMHGIVINSHTKGEYLDDKKFWPILAKAEELGVPIYLHPRCPSAQMLQPFADYPELTGSMFGFGVEASLHALRLICAGVFEEFPKLQVVLGHLGEALPFWLWRVDNRLRHTPLAVKYKRMPSDIFRENMWATTSGNFNIQAFMCAFDVMGADRILFAVDYPMEDNGPAIEFLKSLPISPRDKEKIACRNAEQLLKL